MGGTSKTTQNTQAKQTTDPWSPSIGTMTGILDKLNPMIKDSGLSGTQSTAIDQLQQNAQQGNPFAGQINDFTKDLLGGGGANAQAGNVQGGFDQYKQQLSPYADGSMVGKNPNMQSWIDTIMSDVGNSVNSQFAAAGRDLSGANQQAYGRGVAQGVAPVLANQYNQDVSNQLNAAGSLYGAQNTTSGLLTGMDQQGLANKQQGVANSPLAMEANNYTPQQMLELEQLKKSLPAETLGLLAQIGIPIAGLGGTTNSSGSMQGTQKMSGAQQFATIAQGISSLNSGTGGSIGKLLMGMG